MFRFEIISGVILYMFALPIPVYLYVCVVYNYGVYVCVYETLFVWLLYVCTYYVRDMSSCITKYGSTLYIGMAAAGTHERMRSIKRQRKAAATVHSLAFSSPYSRCYLLYCPGLTINTAMSEEKIPGQTDRQTNRQTDTHTRVCTHTHTHKPTTPC